MTKEQSNNDSKNSVVVEEDGGAQFQSYLNNDGIDELTPLVRKWINQIIFLNFTFEKKFIFS